MGKVCSRKYENYSPEKRRVEESNSASVIDRTIQLHQMYISCVYVLRAFPCAQIVPSRWQQGHFLPAVYHIIIMFLNAFIFRSPVFSSSIDTPLHALDLVRTESWPLACSSDMAVGNLGISQRRFSPRLEMCPLRLLMLFFNVYPVTSVFLSSLCMWDLLFCRYRIWLWCFSLVESPNAQLDTLSFP